MIFDPHTVVMSKPQLRALSNCVNPEHSVNVSGLFVDIVRQRVVASDGHRVMVAGSSPEACRGKSHESTAFIVPHATMKAALGAAGAADAICISLDSNKRVLISIVPKGIAQDKFIASLKIDAFDCASKALTTLSAEPVRAKFPPFEQVLPSHEDWRRREGTATFGIGSRYLADVHTIGRSISLQGAGGAVARVLMPTVKNRLGPVLIALDDLKLGTYWLYCVMPLRI